MSPASAAKVLIVEDEPDVREVIAEVLESEGYATEQAPDGRRALELLHHERRRPDAILLDLMMPVMNGWEFRQRQLGDPALAGIPVVITSAVDPRGLECAAYLGKPFDVDLLLRTIRRVVGTRRRPAKA